MLELAGHLRFLQEPAPHLGVRGLIGEDLLEGNVSVEVGVAASQTRPSPPWRADGSAYTGRVSVGLMRVSNTTYPAAGERTDRAADLSVLDRVDRVAGCGVGDFPQRGAGVVAMLPEVLADQVLDEDDAPPGRWPALEEDLAQRLALLEAQAWNAAISSAWSMKLFCSAMTAKRRLRRCRA